ncbi:2'-5'-oligoadenylate synthase 1-like [Haliotis asinina]|uniref:2'-5'-oligoadenylate synthase 1-like n=1 Tax=Haliotis asinina TaxID=109174 RepID=UPI003531B326
MKTYCSKCDLSFKDDSALYDHTLRACKTCMYCTFKFKDVDEIRKHMKVNHMQISCSQCQKRFFLQGGLDAHINHKHNPNEKKRPGGQRRRRPRPKNDLPKKSSNFFSEMEEHDSVEQYLKDIVQPDQTVLETYKEVIDRLKLLLQRKTQCTVSGVFKGGSFGKGTTIKAKSDIDAVVFINDYKSVSDLKNDMEKVVEDLKHAIEHDEERDVVATNVRTTRYSIQFSLQDGRVDVDLLPAVDVLAGGSKASVDVWKQIKLVERAVQPYYSASFAPQQVAFVKKCPSRVKDLIRLVKHWKRTDHVDIRSYCIELMVINLWQKWGTPETFDTKDRLREIFQQLSSMRKIGITWPDEYDIQKFGGKPLSPYVMDPANPFMNTAPTSAQAKDVEGKARIVYRLLKQ